MPTAILTQLFFFITRVLEHLLNISDSAGEPEFYLQCHKTFNPNFEKKQNLKNPVEIKEI